MSSTTGREGEGRVREGERREGRVRGGEGEGRGEEVGASEFTR